MENPPPLSVVSALAATSGNNMLVEPSENSIPPHSPPRNVPFILVPRSSSVAVPESSTIFLATSSLNSHQCKGGVGEGEMLGLVLGDVDGETLGIADAEDRATHLSPTRTMEFPIRQNAPMENISGETEGSFPL